MKYVDFCGEKVSLLGMGNMRLPTVASSGEKRSQKIDRERATEIIEYALASGINYFDTAYMYHGGDSEVFLGEALSKYDRNSYFLADKMPGMMLGEKPTRATVATIFEEQLSRCRTDRFDFYLLHNVCADTRDVYLDRELGIVEYLTEQKAAGRISHLGFSSHSKPEQLESFISSFPEGTFEFCQLQINYLDWELQNACEQYEIATSHSLPVIVMEPCRGGRLASLDENADLLLKKARPDDSVASWAFRYVASLPNVALVLSGMSNREQAVDNVHTFSNFEPFSDDERRVLEGALDILRAKINVPCTRCRYCEKCPIGLDIPALLASYNRYKLGDRSELEDVSLLPPSSQPSACVACRACASVCPQRIDIPRVFAEFAEKIAEFKSKK